MAVVVVGAGIAGTACAAELAAAGVPVRLVERAGEVGGRMGGRVVAGRPVDLGAAYFTVRDPGFEQVVLRWQAAGLARPWTSELAVLSGGTRDRAPGPQRWAAPGGLAALVADLAAALPVELGHEVRRVGPGPVVDGEPADAVVLAMPDRRRRGCSITPWRPGSPGGSGGPRSRSGPHGPTGSGRSCPPRSSTTTRCSR